MSWTQIGGPARSIRVGQAGLVATNPQSGDVWHWNGAPNNWSRIGGPGADFAVGRDVFGLTPDRQAVMRWTGGTNWEQIGGPAASIRAGGAGLVATNPQSGDVWHWNGAPNNWSRIGGPGADFAVGNEIFGLTPDRGAVMRWTGGGTSWERIGGAASALYVGVGGLAATNPQSGDVWLWRGSPNDWTKIGGPGATFALGQTVFGLTPDRNAVMKWLGSQQWERIADGAGTIVAHQVETMDHVYGLARDGQAVLHVETPTLS